MSRVLFERASLHRIIEQLYASKNINATTYTHAIKYYVMSRYKELFKMLSDQGYSIKMLTKNTPITSAFFRVTIHDHRLTRPMNGCASIW